MVFSRAIVRVPGTSLPSGLSTTDLGRPDYETALAQHAEYVEALRAAGLDVVVLPPDDEHPDSTFVEDTALLSRECAIVTRPGAASRRGETDAIEYILRDFYTNIERVSAPGTVDGGDVIMVGTHFFVGLSGRTNADGARQVIRILEKYGMTGSTIPLADVLHLKSGVAYIERGNLVATGEFLERSEFADFNVIEVSKDESYAANCVWVNDTVLMASGYPRIKQAVEAVGYTTATLDMSEFRKLDGGLSCLSLRF